MEIYLKENNVDHIIGDPYNSQHQGAVEAFNKTIKIFYISQGSSRDFFLVDSINDFLKYFYNRSHNTTEMRPFKLMTKWMIKITQKVKENEIKTRKN